ncbi:MAG: branched-chain amino acid ABC transporter permease [Vallitalea sp.]|nr:branched-chain amino acid ABC transporter permease [Vallitalea sp.]
MNFLQQLFNGIHVGSIYALIALGYTMVYGIVKLINFAHGDILMIGSYFALIAISMLGLPFWMVIIISMLVCAMIGIMIDQIAYKPLRDAPRISALITSLGMSLFLENLFAAIYKPQSRKFPSLIKGRLEIGDLHIKNITIVTIIIAIICMILLEFIVSKTKTGKAMRAVSEDKPAARLMGINVNRIIAITFAIGTALGAIGGILYSSGIALQINPLMGVTPGLKAFIAAVLGGIGIIPGAMLGGFAIGLVESLTKAYISSAWSDGVVYGILIIVLLFKPSGILGKNVKEKV